MIERVKKNIGVFVCLILFGFSSELFSQEYDLKTMHVMPIPGVTAVKSSVMRSYEITRDRIDTKLGRKAESTIWYLHNLMFISRADSSVLFEPDSFWVFLKQAVQKVRGNEKIDTIIFHGDGEPGKFISSKNSVWDGDTFRASSFFESKDAVEYLGEDISSKFSDRLTLIFLAPNLSKNPGKAEQFADEVVKATRYYAPKNASIKIVMPNKQFHRVFERGLIRQSSGDVKFVLSELYPKAMNKLLKISLLAGLGISIVLSYLDMFSHLPLMSYLGLFSHMHPILLGSIPPFMTPFVTQALTYLGFDIMRLAYQIHHRIFPSLTIHEFDGRGQRLSTSKARGSIAQFLPKPTCN
jgi:hypothetical protein